ncbi:MAG: hypothetical protein Q9160_006481, partial [Pyrenula sp. 1 TL-2023]
MPRGRLTNSSRGYPSFTNPSHDQIISRTAALQSSSSSWVEEQTTLTYVAQYALNDGAQSSGSRIYDSAQGDKYQYVLKLKASRQNQGQIILQLVKITVPDKIRIRKPKDLSKSVTAASASISWHAFIPSDQQQILRMFADSFSVELHRADGKGAARAETVFFKFAMTPDYADSSKTIWALLKQHLPAAMNISSGTFSFSVSADERRPEPGDDDNTIAVFLKRFGALSITNCLVGLVGSMEAKQRQLYLRHEQAEAFDNDDVPFSVSDAEDVEEDANEPDSDDVSLPTQPPNMLKRTASAVTLQVVIPVKKLRARGFEDVENEEVPEPEPESEAFS